MFKPSSPKIRALVCSHHRSSGQAWWGRLVRPSVLPHHSGSSRTEIRSRLLRFENDVSIDSIASECFHINNDKWSKNLWEGWLKESRTHHTLALTLISFRSVTCIWPPWGRFGGSEFPTLPDKLHHWLVPDPFDVGQHWKILSNVCNPT